MKTPILIRATELARQHPNTFDVPTAADLAELKVGSLVKVAVQTAPFRGPKGTRVSGASITAERFWVQITAILGVGVYTGRVDNDLIGTHKHGLKADDIIQFSADAIYDLRVRPK